MTFTELKLIEPLLKNLQREGYITPTPIQEKAIPVLLNKRDIFGCAQTGTGKTAAFALPILQQLYTKRDPAARSAVKALILAPTRELALQISDSFTAYGKGLNLRHTVVFGGVSQHPQTKALRNGVDIVVATPGRLLDLMQQGFVRLDKVEYFVLDEADRMLDMGFIHDIKRIISKLPKHKNALMFSATMPDEIRQLVKELLHDPEYINIAPVKATSAQIEQYVFHVQKENKRNLLKHLLQHHDIDHALIFTRTKRGADKVVKDLTRDGIKAEAIHGNKSQSARERALRVFKDRKIRILVATDIASRGIDVDNLSHVINFEIPEQAETYVHRIGRTGRAGASGVALSFCASDEMSYLKDIHKLIKKEIEVVDGHPFRQEFKQAPTRSQPRFSGQRRNR